jgi:hypothetical protein
MRIREKVFVSCAVAAVVGLLAAPAAMATGSYSCSSFVPTVTILAGPCPVTSASPAACEPVGSFTGFTGIKYKVTGNPDHAATVVTANNTVLVPSGFQSYPACAGDPVTGLGKYSCHEEAVKVNPNAAAAGEFWLVVEGQKAAVLQAIALKKGTCTKSLAIAGLGFDVNPFQATQKVETVNFKGCAVDFVHDVLTGAVLSAELNVGESTKPVCSGAGPFAPGSCCSEVISSDVANLTLNLNVPGVGDLGIGQFGDGYISSGQNSCTTRVIGGRVYTWGSPCPE